MSTRNIHKANATVMSIIFMTIFLGELLFFTWCRVQTIGAGYEISKETKNHQDLITLKNNTMSETNIKHELIRDISSAYNYDKETGNFDMILNNIKSSFIYF